MKRGTSGLCGILALDKPSGITSHDVVDVVRRLTGERRVGHAGTLDPLASGLMLVCVGPATRLSQYLTGHDKTYEARIVFGAATDTDDAEGRVTEAYTGKPAGTGLDVLADADPEELLARLVGEHAQLPPAYSAIKKNGVVAYKAAREGRQLELEPRKVIIRSAELLDTGFSKVDLAYKDGRFEAMLPHWDVKLTVSKGTYIRSIARDLGQALGCGAHIGSLCRTAFAKEGCEGIMLDDAFSLTQLVARAQYERPWPWCDPSAALGFETLSVDDADLKSVSCGKALAYSGNLPEGTLVSLLHGRRLAAVYKVEGARLKPEAVIPGGVEGLGTPVALPAWGEELPDDYEPLRAAVAIGVFDGMHIGHQRLLAEMCADAMSRAAQAVVMTFEQDPDEHFGSVERFKLSSNHRRIKDIWKALDGRGQVVTMRADESTFSVEPEDFLARLDSYFDVVSLHVGEGFRFGAGGRGTTAMLAAWCAARGIPFVEHDLVTYGGEPVSSSRIRGLLAAGDVAGAAALRAGRLYRIDGVIVRGRGEGTDMGFATANLDLSRIGRRRALPLEGVYACWACVHGEDEGVRPEACLPAAVNMGRAVSFDTATAEVEAHILGASGEMYGKVCTLWFVKRLRGIRVFEDKNELIETVMGNIAWVRENLTELDPAVM